MMRSTTILAMTAVLTLSTGCLERKETIRVQPDGSVRIEAVFDGDVSDFTGGDALPNKRAGWAVKDESRTDDDDKEKQTRTARMRVRAGEDMPDSYAELETEEYEAALRFPTELSIERRRDGTYYHFDRVYEPRAFARYEYYRHLVEDVIGEDGLLKDRQIEELSDDERLKVLTAFFLIEQGKHLEYVRSGVEAVEEVWPRRYGLAIEKTVKDYFASHDLRPLADLMAQPDYPGRDESINEFGEAMFSTYQDVIEEQMAEMRIPEDEVQAFFDGYALEKMRHEVTQDLQDEKFEIRVQMPGRIVAHDGDRVEGSTVIWEFDAKVFNDRPHTVRVTSRVGPRDRGASDDRDSSRARPLWDWLSPDPVLANRD